MFGLEFEYRFKRFDRFGHVVRALDVNLRDAFEHFDPVGWFADEVDLLYQSLDHIGPTLLAFELRSLLVECCDFRRISRRAARSWCGCILPDGRWRGH